MKDGILTYKKRAVLVEDTVSEREYMLCHSSKKEGHLTPPEESGRFPEEVN